MATKKKQSTANTSARFKFRQQEIYHGDSLGNTMLGYPDTLSVTMEDMIHHGAAVFEPDRAGPGRG